MIKKEVIVSSNDNNEVTTFLYDVNGKEISGEGIYGDRAMLLIYQNGELTREVIVEKNDTSIYDYTIYTSTTPYISGKITKNDSAVGYYWSYDLGSIKLKLFYSAGLNCNSWNVISYNNNYPSSEVIYSCEGDALKAYSYHYSERGELMASTSFDYFMRTAYADTFANGVRTSYEVQTLTGDTFMKDTAFVTREYW